MGEQTREVLPVPPREEQRIRRLLVVGGDGVLGSALLNEQRHRGQPALATTRRRERNGENVIHLDLQDSVERWVPPAVDVAVLCAGITSIDVCARDPVGSRHVNVTQTVKLAETLMNAGCFVVYISTNFVFNGNRHAPLGDDLVCPQTEYGRQRAEVESVLSRRANRSAIVRLTKVFHRDLNIVQTWTHALNAGKEIEAYSDYVCSPLPLNLVVPAIERIAEGGLSGIWQLSALGDISYSDIARILAQRLGADPKLVRSVPAPSEKMQHLPRYASLDVSRASSELGFRAPSPSEAVIGALEK